MNKGKEEIARKKIKEDEETRGNKERRRTKEKR